MSTHSRAKLTGLLVLLGAGWGLTQPLIKIAVSNGHGAMGLVFWQLVIGAIVLTAINMGRGRGIPVTRRAVALYIFIAVFGTVLPGYFSFRAAVHLPAGVMSIIISTIPMMAFPMALILGADRFSMRRLLGLSLGLTGVALIALPQTSLPDPAMFAWLPIALIAPLCYAFEENVVGKWGTLGLDGMQVLQGASWTGAAIALPIALGAGDWVNPLRPWGASEWALLGAGVIHAFVYSAFMWLIVAAGAVFAAQVSTFVTGFGVLWAIVLLGEGYSGYIWTAMAVMIAGLALVQPRGSEAH